jgi:hypothetical protein
VSLGALGLWGVRGVGEFGFRVWNNKKQMKQKRNEERGYLSVSPDESNSNGWSLALA